MKIPKWLPDVAFCGLLLVLAVWWGVYHSGWQITVPIVVFSCALGLKLADMSYAPLRARADRIYEGLDDLVQKHQAMREEYILLKRSYERLSDDNHWLNVAAKRRRPTDSSDD